MEYTSDTFVSTFIYHCCENKTILQKYLNIPRMSTLLQQIEEKNKCEKQKIIRIIFKSLQTIQNHLNLYPNFV